MTGPLVPATGDESEGAGAVNTSHGLEIQPPGDGVTDTVRSNLHRDFALPPLPEGCPYKVEYVDTRLRRPGLKITGTLPAKDYFAELTEGKTPFVTPALMDQFGFIVFENCLGHDDGFWLPRKLVQLPHHDAGTDTDERRRVEVVSLGTHPDPELLRTEAFTAIGDENDVFLELIKFFDTHYLDIGAGAYGHAVHLVQRLFTHINLFYPKYPKEKIDPNTFYFSELKTPKVLWKDALMANKHGLDDFDFSEAFIDYKDAAKLYDALGKCMYFHQWNTNQRLLIENNHTVHAGVPHGMKTLESPTMLISQDFLWSSHGILKRMRSRAENAQRYRRVFGKDL